MQMWRAQLPENFDWQRLAAAGFAKALCRIFLRLSHAKNRRGLSFRVNRGTPPTTLCDAAANGGSFALVRMTARHISQLILRGKSSCSKLDVLRSVFRSRVRWHRIGAAGALCSSPAASLSRGGA